MTVVIIIVVLCLVIMCKWIDCLSDLSMMDCSGVIEMQTARVSALAKFLRPRPLSMDHAHFWRPLPLSMDLGQTKPAFG